MVERRTIGRIAQQTGVSVETIRFYERRGIIDRPKSLSGPRHYDDQQLAQVRYIRIAQKMGLSLKEIQALKLRLNDGKGFCGALRSVVEHKVEAIAAEMQRLQTLQDELTRFLAACRSRADEIDCPVLDALSHG